MFAFVQGQVIGDFDQVLVQLVFVAVLFGTGMKGYATTNTHLNFGEGFPHMGGIIPDGAVVDNQFIVQIAAQHTVQLENRGIGLIQVYDAGIAEVETPVAASTIEFPVRIHEVVTQGEAVSIADVPVQAGKYFVTAPFIGDSVISAGIVTITLQNTDKLVGFSLVAEIVFGSAAVDIKIFRLSPFADFTADKEKEFVFNQGTAKTEAVGTFGKFTKITLTGSFSHETFIPAFPVDTAVEIVASALGDDIYPSSGEHTLANIVRG
jgi:hypothetical protein